MLTSQDLCRRGQVGSGRRGNVVCGLFINFG
jgi:hypothetical protein